MREVRDEQNKKESAAVYAAKASLAACALPAGRAVPDLGTGHAAFTAKEMADDRKPGGPVPYRGHNVEGLVRVALA
jgi:hypothetical protein